MAVEDIEGINIVNSVPHVLVLVYTSKYSKPIKVIAFLDTGAAQTIMNLEVLPQQCWKPFTKVLGSTLLRKDIVVGWDIINKEFLKKCPQPLWKNEQFFVRLPFKKNEDINPTKASHSGMNLEHQRLAFAECTELLQQDLIEPSDAPWWKVMPFRLKTSPSLFQKAMCRVFTPIIDHTPVYIDDIFLFSPIEEAHVRLLQRFSDIVQKYGITLSEKKMVVGQREINFLGMQLANG
ncbi:hypothetical protein CRG98_005942 [Punica granatum]|uniref:Reverse transcriptase domain-containing protein n=1 Tax=Punica granatum TaxID=22663 RepID=A0A2I0KZ17_PUNGR|nr:hypothetical protein CRG98_005942 [Punica granatum]